MKSFVALLAIVAVVAADVSHVLANSEADAEILSQEAEVSPVGFAYSYKTSNGISAQESGALKAGPDGEAIAVEGSNSYTAPGGLIIETFYRADENGYEAQGAHLPTPPPPQEIPEYIQRALEYIRTHPPKEEPIRRV